MSKVIEDAAQDFAAINEDKASNSAHSYSKYDIADAYQQGAEFGYELAENRIKKEYEEKLRWISPNVKPKLMDENSMFSVNVSIRVEQGEYEYSGYYNFATCKWLIFPKEEPFEFELISGWRYFL